MSRAAAATSAPTRSTAAAKSMLRSWPSAALVEGVKIGSSSWLASCSPAGIAVPCTVPDSGVLLVGLAGEVAAHDALELEHVGPPHQDGPAGPVGGQRGVARRTASASAMATGSAVICEPGTMSAISSHQKLVMAVSTRPLSVMGSAMITSNALTRSEATITRRPSPAS